MEIQEIKERLSIRTVLDHYGLKPNKNRMLHCPFHDDKTPSLQVYAETNTVFCFSSNCRLNGKAIDQIDFILHKENCTKHQAIEKAKELAGSLLVNQPSMTQQSQPSVTPGVKEISRIAVFTKVLHQARESIKNSEQAKGYCRERGLDWEKLEAGYLAKWFYRNWNANFKRSAIEAGLLKEQKNGMFSSAFRDCLVFALKNREGKPVGLYGRSVLEDNGKGDGKHFYLAGRHEGLYPGYPPVGGHGLKPGATKLILTESIIDAATLYQLTEITSAYGVLALYGTNGLTEEHKAAIKEWGIIPPSHEATADEKEIIFLLDGDEAGDKATEKYGKELFQLLPEVKISKGNLPEGEDVNSLLAGHEPEIMTHILAERTLFFSSEQPSKENGTSRTKGRENKEPQKEQQPEGPALDTTNPDRIIYHTDGLKIEIWGGIDYGNLHRLKLSLYLENRQTNQSFRDDVNLYSHRSRKGFLEAASEELSMSQTELKEIVSDFTRKVETYRLQQKEKKKTLDRPEPPRLNPHEQAEAQKLLKDRQLVAHLKGAMQKAGLIGETGNGLLLFLIFLTRYFNNPLHALVHGSSGSGKTNLLKSVLKLVPEESRFSTTALTENVLFRPPYREFWKNKILMIEDLDGVYKALLALREFMSNQHISKFVSEPDAKTGQFKQVLLEAHGPIVIAGATTKDKVYEDNSNRSFLLHVDESRAHQERILDYQNRQAAGLVDSEGTEATSRKVHNLQRMLNPKIKVINPFQPQLKLPEYVFKKLRTNTHYITLIKAITFLHQYQREKKACPPTGGTDESGRLYIETTLEDVALANELSRESLLRKSDELSGQLRDFFESLKAIVKPTGNDIFTAKDVRERFRMHPMKLKRRLDELADRGYIRKTGGNRRLSYEYEIAVWDDYQVLQKGLAIMDETLDKLWKRYPDGKYVKEVKSSGSH